ncbi:MAG TPA: thioredoxin family protein, partial [Albitalea sp.]|nr:thioredoxin family protein [Albitalea sp.]
MKRKMLATLGGLLAAAGLAVNCTLFAADGELSPWSAPARMEAPLSSLDGSTGWLNSAALGTQDLRGKVVLVDFWTYSCINCLRTLPYVKAWAQKYRSSGLVVLGVHTPEFEFEQQASNVQRAVEHLHIDYPVALDSRYAIWKAFGNRAWPAIYFVDAQGRIRQRQYGEGRYAEAEQLIQQLLKEAGSKAVPTGLVSPLGEGTQAAAATAAPESEETYVGVSRASGFVSADGPLHRATERTWPATTGLRSNQWTLTGTWRTEDEFASSRQAGAGIAYRFRARDLHLVLGTDGGRPARFRVRVDGLPPGQDHGTDIDAQGTGTVTAHRLYQLVRQHAGARERT